MRILAVDDDSSILELLPLIAAKAGFPDVTVSASGELALDTIRRATEPFECLLLDINMPQMDGIELCTLVRQMAGYETTPVIMLTAMSDHAHVESAFKAGATDYATKPFDITELSARLRIAQEIVALRRKLAGSLAAQQTAGSGGQGPPVVHLGQAIFVRGIRNVIDLAAFRNYLKEMSRSGLAATQIIAVKIDRVAEIHSQTTAAEFTEALGGVARAIAEALLTTSSITSYAGNGLFLSLSRSTIPLDALQIESDVQQVLDERSPAYLKGAPLDLEVSVGPPVLPHFADAPDLSQLLDRVAARAEHRSASKAGARDGPNIRQIRF